MQGLLDPSILQGLLYNYPAQNVDQSGFPIDVTRPIVFDEGRNEPHTELTATYTAKDLGLPGEGFYNVPTIYGGKIFDPDKDFDKIKENVQSLYSQGIKFPIYKDEKIAVEQAIKRSQKIGEIRGQELSDAVRNRQSNMLMGLLGY
jgi:hypothetical protein